MTNAEKYLKENVNVDEFVSNFLHQCNCPREDLEEFLNKEVKPILSEDEKVILKNIPNAQKIFRTSCGLYIEFPDEGKYIKVSKGFSFYEHLFKFIKPRRRI